MCDHRVPAGLAHTWNRFSERDAGSTARFAGGPYRALDARGCGRSIARRQSTTSTEMHGGGVAGLFHLDAIHPGSGRWACPSRAGRPGTPVLPDCIDASQGNQNSQPNVTACPCLFRRTKTPAPQKKCCTPVFMTPCRNARPFDVSIG